MASFARRRIDPDEYEGVPLSTGTPDTDEYEGGLGLLSCPFCGNTDTSTVVRPGDGWAVCCLDERCGVIGPYASHELLARGRWNARRPGHEKQILYDRLFASYRQLQSQTDRERTEMEALKDEHQAICRDYNRFRVHVSDTIEDMFAIMDNYEFPETIEQRLRELVR